MASSPIAAQASRPCSYCGKPVPMRLNRCPHCREEVREVRLISSHSTEDGSKQIRRGLFYMLLGAVIYYFSGGYSPMPLPVNLSPLVVTYLAPVVFLGGLSLSLYGMFVKIRS